MEFQARRQHTLRMAHAPMLPRRQRLRRGLLYTSVLLFPVTMYYMSPVLSLAGVADNIVAGSVIVFAAQFVLALFLGRAFCGWVCPAGGVQEIFSSIRPTPISPRWIRWIKWVIWLPWFGFLMYLLISRRGELQVDMAAFTQSGISLTDVQGYVVYYIVLTVFVLLALAIGRRAGCHALCWMAPFMVLGRKLRNLLSLPALHLQSEPDSCVHCSACSDRCPMSIDVETLVAGSSMEHSDCMLCGECVDGCRTAAIRYGFSRGTFRQPGRRGISERWVAQTTIPE